MSSDPVSRRRVLQLSGTALAAGLAGCGAQLQTDTTQTTDAETTDRTETTQATETTDRTEATDSGQATADEEQEQSVYTRVYEDTIGSVVLVNSGAGQGTGFVYDDRHVVTNAHVVGNAGTVQVRFREGEWRTGEVVGTDVYSDLAAVRVSDRPPYADPLPFIDGASVVGQEVVVLGNPFGLDGTATTGIVSGVNRSIPSPAGFSIPDAVQTDAAVNPGNSGGPIVSLDGEVIAVINSGGGDNVAFGISAALTRRVVPELIESGEYEHAYMGVSLRDVTPAVAQANDLDSPRGIVVVNVVSGGPSDGVLRGSDDQTVVDGERVPVGGDVIVEMGDADITTLEELSSFLALQTRPGETVTVTVLRDGGEQTVDLTLGTRPPP